MNTYCNFYVSKPFQAKMEVVMEAWRNGKDVFSVEVCSAIIERYDRQQVRGFVMPTLDQPAIDLASLLADGKISVKEGHQIVTAMEQHIRQYKRLKIALSAAEENSYPDSQLPEQ